MVMDVQSENFQRIEGLSLEMQAVLDENRLGVFDIRMKGNRCES